MAKAASPIRLQQDLMDQASMEGKLNHRSAAEQAEYWMDIGRRISRLIKPETLLSISAGLATIHVEPVKTKAVSPETIFNNLERQRNEKMLNAMVTGAKQRYQASTQFPGFLERIEDELVTVGQFKDGEFVPTSAG